MKRRFQTPVRVLLLSLAFATLTACNDHSSKSTPVVPGQSPSGSGGNNGAGSGLWNQLVWDQGNWS